MKGKNTLMKSEIEAIKKLIAEKVKASPREQKVIRSRIRKLGFYYSDFSASKHGYTVEDFDAILNSGRIKII